MRDASYQRGGPDRLSIAGDEQREIDDAKFRESESRAQAPRREVRGALRNRTPDAGSFRGKEQARISGGTHFGGERSCRK
jgi:hypothetical protein